MGLRWKIVLGLAFLILIAVSAEIGLRLAGAGSYPLYDTDDEIKYIPSASQHGSFLNRYVWHFNDRHMAHASNWRADTHPSLVIVGNSIVLGGTRSNHEEKLGPQLEKALNGKYTVWPVAAGGWTNINELVYLDRNADVLRNADAVVLEFMEGGLSVPTPWPGYDIFPDRKPWILTGYMLRRYLQLRLTQRSPRDFGALPAIGPPGESEVQRFKTLVAGIAKKHRVIIFLYPTAGNLRNRSRWLEAIAPLEELCKATAAKCVDIAREPGWDESAYMVDGIHQTAEGTKRLASILANAVNQ